MPPKKTSTAGASKPKAAAAPPAHASYQDMIKEAIINLKERNGSSRQAIKKYVQANNNLSATSEAQVTSLFNKALQKGSDAGTFARPKGSSGPVKLAKPADKAAAKTEKTEKAEKAEKKPAATKKTTTKTEKVEKKPAATKKTTTKTTKAKAPAAKKASATKTKTTANTSKARKATPKAPAAVSIHHFRPNSSHWMWAVNDGYASPLPDYKIAASVARSPDKDFTSAQEYHEYLNRELKAYTSMTTQAPAVEEKEPVELGKTKSGRVTKSRAPQPAAKAVAPKKKAAAKKTSKAKA